MPDTNQKRNVAGQAAANRSADAALKLVEARAQIEELIEVNQRLRRELSEMTLMWVTAETTPSRLSPGERRAPAITPPGRNDGSDPGCA